jgi:hypothetical protein
MFWFIIALELFGLLLTLLLCFPHRLFIACPDSLFNPIAQLLLELSTQMLLNT